MRRILFLCLMSILLLLFVAYVKHYGWSPIYQGVDTIQVTLMYHNEAYELNLEPYDTLAVALQQIPLEADVDYEKLNPQQILKHQDAVVIPILTETPCVALNTATAEELQTLSGIGQKTAERIIAHRNQEGLFQTIDDLMKVKGIGSKKFAKIQDSLCL